MDCIWAAHGFLGSSIFYPPSRRFSATSACVWFLRRNALIWSPVSSGFGGIDGNLTCNHIAITVDRQPTYPQLTPDHWRISSDSFPTQWPITERWVVWRSDRVLDSEVRGHGFESMDGGEELLLQFYSVTRNPGDDPHQLARKQRQRRDCPRRLHAPS
ncbi:hypothetical protein Bbelb_288490 [Branchiostoma belcheri]|nr:hypothetical protein Bbelb_288490 [Branchiostoma belcheri]